MNKYYIGFMNGKNYQFMSNADRAEYDMFGSKGRPEWEPETPDFDEEEPEEVEEGDEDFYDYRYY